MRVIVNPHKIELIQEEAVNEKEIDISKCEFEFDDEITDDYVKEAYFTLGDTSYKKIIVNNKCDFPQEVLVRPATIELGVVAYLVEDETEIKRYNPTPVYFKTDLGSLKNAENSEEPTPSEMEQYEQALQDGLSEVNDKLADIDEAILETSNLNITAEKTNNVTYVTITDKEGNDNTVEILDGEKGETGDRGPQGIQGPVGQTGPAGRDGTDGTDGVDGVSPIATVSKSNGTATITITDKNGTTTATVSDGQDGTNGTNGRDGYVQYTAGDNITISNNTISATVPQIDLSNYYTKSEVDSKVIYGGRVSEHDADHRISLNEIEPGIYEYWADRNGSSAYSEQYLCFKATINGTVKLLGLVVPSRMDDKKIINDMVYVEIKNKVPETVTGSIEVGRFFYDYVNSGGKRVGKISKSIYALTSGLSTYDDNSQNFELYLCDTTSAQTISGKKTFMTLPESDVVPSNNKQFTNKKYVDDAIANIPSGGGSMPLYTLHIDGSIPSTYQTYVSYTSDSVKEQGASIIEDILENQYFASAILVNTTDKHGSGLYLCKPSNYNTILNKSQYCQLSFVGLMVNAYSSDANALKPIFDLYINATRDTTTGVVTCSGVSLTYQENSSLPSKAYLTDKFKADITGYNASKTQILKNVNGTLQWIDE